MLGRPPSFVPMAIDVNALEPAVNEVIEANIPIVTVDRYVSGTNKPVPQFGTINRRAAPRFTSQEDNLRAVRKVIDDVPGQLGPSNHETDSSNVHTLLNY